MRNSSQIDLLLQAQQQLEFGIFTILIKSKVISQLSCTIDSRLPFYQFTTVYDYLKENLPEQAVNFGEAVKGLFKSNFLYLIVVEPLSHHIQFMTRADYENMTLAERFQFPLVPSEVVFNTKPLN